MDVALLATYVELAMVSAAIVTVVPVLFAMAAASCARILTSARQGLRALPRRRSPPTFERTASFGHLPEDLAAFGQATFCMLEELDHFSRAGADAPTSERSGAPLRWLHRIGGALGDPSGELDEARTAAEIWQWVILAETIGATRREEFGLLGVAHTRVRDALTSSSSLRSRLPSIAQELVHITEALSRYSAADYRGLRLRPPKPTPPANGQEAAPQDSTKRRRRFREVEEKHTPLLARIAAQYASTPADRDDLLQEIKLAIWNALPAFRGESSLRTYVVRIAYNRAASVARRRSRAVMLGADAPSVELDVENLLVLQERRGWLRRAIDHLPQGVAAAFKLRLAGASYKEIAAALDISTTNVGVRLHTGRAQLKALAVGEQLT